MSKSLPRRHGPLVTVSVEYKCEGCHHSRVESEGDPCEPSYIEWWYCDEPSLVADYGCGQFVSHEGKAAPICPFRDDDRAREAKRFHREIADHERNLKR